MKANSFPTETVWDILSKVAIIFALYKLTHELIQGLPKLGRKAQLWTIPRFQVSRMFALESRPWDRKTELLESSKIRGQLILMDLPSFRDHFEAMGECVEYTGDIRCLWRGNVLEFLKLFLAVRCQRDKILVELY